MKTEVPMISHDSRVLTQFGDTRLPRKSPRTKLLTGGPTTLSQDSWIPTDDSGQTWSVSRGCGAQVWDHMTKGSRRCQEGTSH